MCWNDWLNAWTVKYVAARALEGAGVDEISSEIGWWRIRVYRLVQENEIFFPPKRGRKLPPKKSAELRRLLLETELSRQQIADRIGCSKGAVHYQAMKMRGGGPRKLQKPRRCPEHGLIRIWPCVACMAERKT